jgi:hypothetical protein
MLASIYHINNMTGLILPLRTSAFFKRTTELIEIPAFAGMTVLIDSMRLCISLWLLQTHHILLKPKGVIYR